MISVEFNSDRVICGHNEIMGRSDHSGGGGVTFDFPTHPVDSYSHKQPLVGGLNRHW